MKQKKLKKITSCQSFSPIKDIRDGIIVTKKGNFVKLMEFAPINFSLRSASERNLIISQYQAAIRTFLGRYSLRSFPDGLTLAGI